MRHELPEPILESSSDKDIEHRLAKLEDEGRVRSDLQLTLALAGVITLGAYVPVALHAGLSPEHGAVLTFVNRVVALGPFGFFVAFVGTMFSNRIVKYRWTLALAVVGVCLVLFVAAFSGEPQQSATDTMLGMWLFMWLLPPAALIIWIGDATASAYIRRAMAGHLGQAAISAYGGALVGFALMRSSEIVLSTAAGALVALVLGLAFWRFSRRPATGTPARPAPGAA